MIGIPLGLAYINMGEWLVHRYVLHGLGRWRKGPFAFHYYEHHQSTRKNQGHDPHYQRSVFGLHTQGQEAIGLAVAGVVHLPLLPIAPFFTSTVIWSLFRYHKVHKRAHLDPAWARQHLPWHYDHHMGPDQESNWCVTRPWFDRLMGTRKPYVGTEREQRDRRAPSPAEGQAAAAARAIASCTAAHTSSSPSGWKPGLPKRSLHSA